MLEWCMEHPLMTFTLLLVLFSSIKIRIGVKNWQNVVRLEMRVHELEEIICPCEQHDWLQIDSRMKKKDGELKEIKRFVCSKCKRTKEE